MDKLSRQDPRARRAYRVENLNKDLGITASMRKSGSKYATVLCLPNVTRKTLFLSEDQALSEMRRYRALYKQKKQKGI